MVVGLCPTLTSSPLDDIGCVDLHHIYRHSATVPSDHRPLHSRYDYGRRFCGARRVRFAPQIRFAQRQMLVELQSERCPA